MNKTIATLNFKDHDLKDIQVLYLYGVDLNLLPQIKKWLMEDEERYFVFLEDNLIQLEKLKNRKEYQQFLSTERASLHLLEEDIEKSLKEISWKNLFLSFKILPSKKENFLHVKTLLEHIHLGVNLVGFAYSDFGVNLFENLYLNMLNTKELVLGKDLENSFKDIPAIICGAGPSLDKNIFQLKELSDKVLLFAGGTALNILSEENIPIDFAANIDGKAPFDRFKKHSVWETIFFYQNQISNEAFKILHNKKVLSSNDLYPLEKWFYEKLKIDQPEVSTGWTVGTFLIKMAEKLGCSPIIFVGLDYSYKDVKYAKNMKEEQNNSLIETRDIDNQKVVTQKDWLLAKKWIEELARSSKGKYLNATEGGIGFENIENRKLSEVLDTLKTQTDLKALVHAKYQNSQMKKIKKKEVKKIIEKIKNSFLEVDVLCDEYLLEMQDLHYQDNIFIKFQKEIVYTHLIDPIWNIWKYVFDRLISDSKERTINKLLFFKKVIAEHLEIIRKVEDQ